MMIKPNRQKLKTVPSASLNAALFGVPKMFIPRWFQINNFMTGNFYFGQQQLPWNWTYIYDNSPLIKTLKKYINFQKLSPNSVSSCISFFFFFFFFFFYYYYYDYYYSNSFDSYKVSYSSSPFTI